MFRGEGGGVREWGINWVKHFGKKGLYVAVYYNVYLNVYEGHAIFLLRKIRPSTWEFVALK